MTLLNFNIIIIIMVALDVILCKYQVTPLSIIGTIYLLLIDINNLWAAQKFHFWNLNENSLGMLVLFFFSIFLVDVFFDLIYRVSKKKEMGISFRPSDYRVARIIFFVGAIAYAMQFVRLHITIGWNIKGMNNGILGHLSSLAFIFGPIALEGALKKESTAGKIVMLIAYVIIFGIAILFGGKYVIFINLTYCAMFFLLKRDSKKAIKRLLIAGMLMAGFAISVFAVLYYVIPMLTGRYVSSGEFVIEHTLYYLLGPVIANNDAIVLAGTGCKEVPFAVFINIAKALFGDGDYINPILPFVFSTGENHFVNVSGMFGETVYNLGISGALVYTICVFIVLNILMLLYRTYNCFYVSFCYLCAITAFMFFCNFISVSGVVIPFILAIIVDAVLMIRPIWRSTQ